MHRILNTVAAILFSPKSRKILVLFLAGAFVFSIVQSVVKPALNPFGVGLPSPMVQYISEYGHFSIDRPERWNAFDTPQGNRGDQDVIAFISSGPSSASVFVAVKNFPDGTIEQVAEWGETRASMEPGYTLIALEPFQISHYEGLVRKYTRSVDIPLLGLKTDYFEDRYVLQDGRGFIISFRASQELWPDVADTYWQMMESFTILEGAYPEIAVWPTLIDDTVTPSPTP